MSATLSTPKTTSGGEIIRELVNASDGQGLHFDGAAGNIDFTPPDLGTKFSFEFIIQADSWPASGTYSYIVDFGNGGRFVLGNPNTGNFSVRSVTGDWLSFGSALLDDLKVHHVVVTVDGTSAIAYDNGNQIGTATITSPNIDSCADARIGSDYVGTASFFDGTIYRARFWNKTLKQGVYSEGGVNVTYNEVRDAYENATVPFADQYGSQTNKITAAVDKNWGTNQADTGNDTNDRATFNTNYGWNTDGNITDISVANNVLQFTSKATGTSGLYYPFAPSANKRYRVVIACGTITGGTFKVQTWNGSGYDNQGTLVASTTNTFDFTAPASVAGYVYLNTTDGSATIQLNAASVSTEFVAAGCVADYDLAFANVTQSTIIQNRSGSGDGTSSASGVTQVTPIEQVNVEKLSVGGATPRIGVGLVAGTAAGYPVHIQHSSEQLRLWGSAAGATDQYASIAFSNTGQNTLNIATGYQSGSNANEISLSPGGKKLFSVSGGNYGTGIGNSEFFGNVGLGVTPEAWQSTRTALHIGGNGTLNTTTGVGWGGHFDIAQNAYINTSGSWSYISTDEASVYNQVGGKHTFKVAASGTADAAITWTDALTISSTGLTTVTNPGWPLKNELSNSGFDVWSNSTLEDATGTNLVSSWDDVSYPYEIAFTTGGANITRAAQDASSGVGIAAAVISNPVVGKLYEISFSIAKASGTMPFVITATGEGYSNGSVYETPTAGSNTYVFEASANDVVVQFWVNSGVATDFAVSSFTLKEVTPGCVVADPLAFDGWSKGSGLDVWREHPGSNTYQGSYYALKMNSSVATSGIYWPHHAVKSTETYLDKFKGRTITFGAWVKTAAADDFKLRVFDNGTNPDSYSAANVASGNFQWLEVTHEVSTDVTDLRFILQDQDTGVDIYISQPMLVFGSAIGAGNYSRPSGEIVWFEKADVQLNSYNNVTNDTDATVNLEAESNGKIPKGARAVNCMIRGKDSAVADGVGFNVTTSAGQGGIAVWPSVSNISEINQGWVPCDSNGDIYYNASASGSDTLSGVYITPQGVQLR